MRRLAVVAGRCVVIGHRVLTLVLAGAMGLAAMSAGTPAAAAPKPVKQATVTMAFVRADGRCYPQLVATWSGYQVNHVRFLGYLEGRSGNDATWLDTKTYPKSESRTSGSFTSTSFMVARPGEGWYAYAIFRTVGGARQAEASSAVEYAPLDCVYP